MTGQERRQLRTFGLGLCAMLLVGAWGLRARDLQGPALALLLAAAGFGLGGLCAPRILAPVYAPWMRMAHGLAWVNTRLLLGLTFYLVVTPLGQVMRLLGRDPLGRTGSGESYWRRPPEHSLGNKHFEQPF
jgi:hypothetical protein